MNIAGNPPPALALALIDLSRIHDVLDCFHPLTSGMSRGSCISCTLIACEFLRERGIDSEPRSVIAGAVQEVNGRRVASPLVGADSGPCAPNQWRGHLVTLADGYIIDLTLYALTWRGPRGMFADPLAKGGTINKLLVLGRHEHRDVNGIFQVFWLDNASNQTWRLQPDAAERDAYIKIAGILRRA